MEMKRKLAEVVRIEEIRDIPDADAICQYRVQGWWVVDKKGVYKVGDTVIYCQIDSWIPTALAPFLTKGKTPRVYNEVSGERLRTVKLRGALSQGLLLPITLAEGSTIGQDLTDVLGIQKWEPPQEFTSADTKGSFPSFIQKTDQARIQTVYQDVLVLIQTGEWQVTEKLEGQSFTAYLNNNEFGVASRNLDLKYSDDNTFWNTARKYALEEKLRAYGRNLAIQGEQCGPGISGNIYKLDSYVLRVFDVFDIDAQRYLSVEEKQKVCRDLCLDMVPVIFDKLSLTGKSLDDILDMANGKTVLNKSGVLREGLVFTLYSDDRVSFKSISNEYLLKQK
jgi:RNA ligase (TIGR02306 family)